MKYARPNPLDLFWAVWGGGVRSLREVAKEYGISHTAVIKWCNEEDIPHPSAHEMRRLQTLRKKASLQTVRASVRERAREELERECDRLWAYHGCDAFLARHGCEGGAVAIG